MHVVLSLLTVQVVLGFFDNLWHHEISERLPAKRAARVELALHALREWIYAFVFLAIAWWSWHGAWSWLLGGLLLIEIVTTLTDFVVEDTTRRLPKLERMLHTVLAINFGAILALLAPTLVAWSREPTAIVPSGYGAWSWFFAACSAGVLAWGARDALAALRHFRPAAWQRRKLVTAQAPRSKRILVTGATGFIGRELTYRLIERGDRVIVLTRDRDKAVDLFGAHAQIVTNLAVLPNDGAVDAIVNLAGAGIAERPWTARRKRTLLESRLGVTDALLALVGRLAVKPRTWVNASAVGYYGVRGDDERLHEKSAPQTIFQSQLCSTWEAAARKAERHGVKVAYFRIGLVLGCDGGALPALALPVRFGLGMPFGSGAQWVSWIHRDDLIELFLFVLDQETLAGPLNATAPTPVRHAELMEAIAVSLGRRLWPVNVPAKLLRTVLGELAQLFVDGQRVTPDRALALGFHFRYATIGAALAATFSAPSAESRKRSEPAAATNGPRNSEVAS